MNTKNQSAHLRVPSQAAGKPQQQVSLNTAFEMAWAHQSAGRLREAEQLYQLILGAAPQHPRARHLLGVIEMQRHRYEAAAGIFQAILVQWPDSPITLSWLASALHLLGQLTQAEQCARRSLELNDRRAETYDGLGRILLDSGDHGAAAACFAQAAKLQPEDANHMSSLLHCRSVEEGVDPHDLALLHRRFGDVYEAPLRGTWPKHENPRDPGRRLRVGFVSGDLRRHAVAYFLEPVWRAIDRQQVELFAYSNHNLEDDVSERLKRLTDHWRLVPDLDDAQLAERIRGDGIDILVDLSGHTAHNRLLAFARKPAPVQVSWIGYPESTGLTAIDYLMVNAESAPPGPIDALYVEKLVRLDASGAFQRDLQSPAVNPLPALERGYITFCSLNRMSKLNDTVLATWGRVLHAVPDSRLLLGNVFDSVQEDRLRQRLAEQGVAANRLRFAPRLPIEEYLKLHHEVDVLLDTFPYTGGTTTQHALWMGVPVITLAGLRRSERISTANLTSVGLADWSVTSTDAYVARAVAAASDLACLAELRAGLRQRVDASPWRRPDTVARSLEIAFRVMWQRWCEGLPPEAFSVTLDQALQRKAA